MPYVFLVTDLPCKGCEQRFILSLPCDDLKEAQEHAINIAARTYATVNPKSGGYGYRDKDIKGTYQIIELHIPIESYNKWYSSVGTFIFKDKVREFTEMNEKAAPAKAKMNIFSEHSATQKRKTEAGEEKGFILS